MKSTSSKICGDCKATKPIEDFYTKGKSASGRVYYDAYCKLCSIARTIKRPAKPRSPETRSAWAKQRRGDPETRYLVLWKEYRQIDRAKGRENDLTKEQVRQILEQPCVHCGDTETMMTVDRIDNALGHQTGNVEPACLRCNLVRGDMPHGAWLTVAPGMRTAREAGQFEGWLPKRRGGGR